MNQIIPPGFLFRWSFAARKYAALPAKKGRLLDLPDSCLLPSLAELDQKSDFAQVKLAWNDAGLAISFSVTGRSRRPECVASELLLSDGMRLWIDTRNTQAVHRATRFCHHFVLLPAGRGPGRNQPVIRSLPVARAREDSTLPDAELVQVQSDVSDSGYWLDAWFPAAVFAGFDPASHSRIGFHYVIHDTEFGDQTLAVGGEFPYESDPSLWQTVELVQ